MNEYQNPLERSVYPGHGANAPPQHLHLRPKGHHCAPDSNLIIRDQASRRHVPAVDVRSPGAVLILHKQAPPA